MCLQLRLPFSERATTNCSVLSRKVARDRSKKCVNYHFSKDVLRVRTSSRQKVCFFNFLQICPQINCFQRTNLATNLSTACAALVSVNTNFQISKSSKNSKQEQLKRKYTQSLFSLRVFSSLYWLFTKFSAFSHKSRQILFAFLISRKSTENQFASLYYKLCKENLREPTTAE